MATAIEVRTAHGAGHDSHDGSGHSDHPPTSTGLNSRKMLMWLFLTSDCMFFGTLIATYMIVPQPQHRDRNAAVPERDLRHPLHLGQRLRAPHVLADDGAGAGGDSARQPPRAAHLDLGNRAPRRDLRRWPVLRVHHLRPRGADAHKQHLWLLLLRPDRLPRRARDDRGGLAPVDPLPLPARRAASRRSPSTSRSPGCTGTSSTSSGSSSSPSSTWSRTRTDRQGLPRRRRRHSCGS